MHNIKMVEDVLLQWEQMTGESPLAKQINALLTAAFIMRVDIPSDECATEAAWILDKRAKDPEWEPKALAYLIHRFATHIDRDKILRETPGMQIRCVEIRDKIKRLCEATEPTDLMRLLGDS